MSISIPLFALPELSYSQNTPVGMAKSFNVPYLGKLSMDKNILKSCESGVSFTEKFPSSSAAIALVNIVDKIIEAVSNNNIVEPS